MMEPYIIFIRGENMEMTIIILLILSILLLALSFSAPDRISALEKNVEKLTMQQVQDTYLLKQRVRVLEEELLLTFSDEEGDLPGLRTSVADTPGKANEILKSQVLSLHRQGYGIDEICERSVLEKTEVANILQRSGETAP